MSNRVEKKTRERPSDEQAASLFCKSSPKGAIMSNRVERETGEGPSDKQAAVVGGTAFLGKQKERTGESKNGEEWFVLCAMLPSKTGSRCGDTK